MFVKSLGNDNDWKLDFIKILLGKRHSYSKTLLIGSDAGLKNLALEYAVTNYPIYISFNHTFYMWYVVG